MVSFPHMKNALSVHRCGIALGALLGGWHAIWSILVAGGIAQPLLDFMLLLHMIRVPVTVQPFHLVMALTLVVVTGGMGYLFGVVFAALWNAVHEH